MESLNLTEIRYPLVVESEFHASDPRLERISPILIRSLQLCMHETYFDCPYYEQMMYSGDTRLQVLVTYAITHDDRLPLKTLALFDASRMVNGLTQSRYPSHVRQTIPPFSLWYVGMVHDHALWRGNKEFIRTLMPGLRGVLDVFLSYRNEQGLMKGPVGWNFIDWVSTWRWGIPPDGDYGVNGAVNWLTVLALDWMAQLETWLEEPELAQRWGRHAEQLFRAILGAFWNVPKARFSDDLAHEYASEHVQTLALLSGRLPEEQCQATIRALLEDQDLSRVTIFFRHYLIEALRRQSLADAVYDRLALWFDLESSGVKTTPETPEPTRSDCHGWGATPIYHYLSTLVGIRPDGFGFETVRIRPLFGYLTHLQGRMPHPNGFIDVDLLREENQVSGKIGLPKGLSGRFILGKQEVLLTGGESVQIRLRFDSAPIIS
jgi:alpha-L-rhamnosidase